MGNRYANLRFAIREIGNLARVLRVSPFFETEPEGYADQRRFLNAAVEIRTGMPAEDLLTAVQGIEGRRGRRKTFRNGPRVLDVDLLDVGGRILSTRRLTLPHPRMHRRRFVLEPLAAIAPRWRHPVLHKTAKRLLQELP
jgi:2-amino-4-hydroxy-6-hydroxymethyldihydropteridine diphosphokinase